MPAPSDQSAPPPDSPPDSPPNSPPGLTHEAISRPAPDEIGNAEIEDPAGRLRFGPDRWWLPWTLSFLVHFTIALALAFVVWNVLPAVSPAKEIVPVIELGEDPGEPIREATLQSPAPRASPVRAVRPVQPSLSSIEAIEPDPLIGETASLSANPLRDTGTDQGRGIGFFGSRGGDVERLVYVVDASGSLMDTMPFVVGELKRSIRSLGQSQRFTVLFATARGTVEAAGRGMKPANDRHREAVLRWLADLTEHVVVMGSGDTVEAIGQALSYQPELVYLLSDNITGQGRYEIDRDVFLQRVGQANRRGGETVAKFNTIQFLYPDPLATRPDQSDGTLALLAEQTGGTFRFVSARELYLE